ncbi:hypothetical protein FH972_020702 [Carpinus fangiana]|uniref:Uncharacterized protein n=1 Tax=Carpinus fangiana TaxID=176857 RepID=A0A5N6RUG2_9ROSI|nr:hypothetical protein FH972_020702 [Carpinus fangiana]
MSGVARLGGIARRGGGVWAWRREIQPSSSTAAAWSHQCCPSQIVLPPPSPDHHLSKLPRRERETERDTDPAWRREKRSCERNWAVRLVA